MASKKARGIALQAVQEVLRLINIPPETVDTSEVFEILDELVKTQPQSVAAQWWQCANGREFDCFIDEWEDWREQYLRLCPFCRSPRESEEFVFCQACEDFFGGKGGEQHEE